MKRRAFIALIGSAAAAPPLLWPLATRAEDRGRIPTIGVLMNYAESDPEGQARFSVLREQLRKLGWTAGGNVRIEVRWAAAKPDRMLAAAAELIGLPADVLAANSTPMLEVLKPLTRTIPIVFTQVADPIGSGFVGSYARPEGNITGFTDFDASIAGKWMELLKEAAPSVRRVTVLRHPDQANHPAFVRVLEAAASSLKLEVSAVAVRDRGEVEQAIASLSGQTDRGLIVLPGAVNNSLRGTIIQSAARYRLPAVYPFKYYATDGGLLYYGADQLDQWPKAAGYIDRILRGEKPGDLPVQAPTKYELVVNLTTAKALGLDLPATLLARADEVIE
jgi:putative ABC transport system substrate-binding protein